MKSKGYKLTKLWLAVSILKKHTFGIDPNPLFFIYIVGWRSEL